MIWQIALLAYAALGLTVAYWAWVKPHPNPGGIEVCADELWQVLLVFFLWWLACWPLLWRELGVVGDFLTTEIPSPEEIATRRRIAREKKDRPSEVTPSRRPKL